MAHVPPGQASCPTCGARATAQATACANCGYRFVEDFPRARAAARTARRRAGTVALAAVVIAGLGYAASLLTADGQQASGARGSNRGTPDAVRTDTELLARHPLSTRAVERRLEARFAPPADDGRVAARCSAREPRPLHAIRRCHIHHPDRRAGFVVVLTNARADEVLVYRWGTTPRR
jgi:ribosomal protein L40E